MPGFSRRQALGGIGAAAAAGIGAAAIPGSAGAATPPPLDGQQNYLFKLSRAEVTERDGGSIRGAHEGNFPILAGQDGSVYLAHLDPGGIREPHWHPLGWELNYVVRGNAKWTILGTHPDGKYHNAVFDAEAGDLVFAPPGTFHYFENPSPTEGLDLVIFFNTSTKEPNDDIGIVGSMNALPRDVLAASLGVPVSALAQIPQNVEPVVITRHRK